MKLIKQITNRINNKNNKVKIMKQGTVKFFNNAKGFGFITFKDSDEDVFVHKNGLIDQIHENDNVKFDLERGSKGMNAVNVELM